MHYVVLYDKSGRVADVRVPAPDYIQCKYIILLW